MKNQIFKVGQLKQQNNFVPLPYRCVSYQPYEGELTEKYLLVFFSSREVYRRTDIVVLHRKDGAHAVVAIERKNENGLFSKINRIEIIALPDKCFFIHSPLTDPANPSALAQLALDHGVSKEQTAIIHGAFDHINIIHRPDPLLINVIEVTPPEPPKLFHMAQQVLSYAQLPPIKLNLISIDIRQLAEQSQPESFLVPCRSGGLDQLHAPIYFLDERPEHRENWTLIGCERSLQFHRHYYQDEPPRIEMCPKQLNPVIKGKVLLKCCLLEFDIECEQDRAVVPWGADLTMVEQALGLLSEE